MNEWWLGLAAAQATVSCGGQEHRLRWEAGELRSLDHGDAGKERALAALGGLRCACVDLLDAWDRHGDDVRVFVLASRGPTDPLVVPEDPNAARVAPAPGVGSGRRRRRTSGAFMGQAAVVNSGWTAYGASGRISQTARGENELFALLGLGGGLPDRLVATVAATWRERLGQRHRAVARTRPQLRAALHGRVFAVMQSWLGPAGSASRVRMVGERDNPNLVREDGVVRAELPFGWLVDVWARDLATIWGRF